MGRTKSEYNTMQENSQLKREIAKLKEALMSIRRHPTLNGVWVSKLEVDAIIDTALEDGE